MCAPLLPRMEFFLLVALIVFDPIDPRRQIAFQGDLLYAPMLAQKSLTHAIAVVEQRVQLFLQIPNSA